jgi:hypothetical protein
MKKLNSIAIFQMPQAADNFKVMFYKDVFPVCCQHMLYILQMNIVNNIAEGTKSDSTFILHFYKFINLKKKIAIELSYKTSP